MPKKREDYQVGFGKPPKATQFKPGQSGNPTGRPKGGKGVKTIMRAIADRKLTMTVDGKKRRVSRLEALFERLIHDALKGDARAQHQFLSLALQVFGTEEEATMKEKLSAGDEAIMNAFRQRASKRGGQTDE